MSRENIAALIARGEEDPALADALRRAGGLETLVQIGAERGYEFTPHELETYFEALHVDELSDQELSSISGGAADFRSSPLNYELERCFVKSWSTSGHV